MNMQESGEKQRERESKGEGIPSRLHQLRYPGAPALLFIISKYFSKYKCEYSDSIIYTFGVA